VKQGPGPREAPRPKPTPATAAAFLNSKAELIGFPSEGYDATHSILQGLATGLSLRYLP
jgi:hypothetical protein